jgi:hypothetical protein
MRPLAAQAAAVAVGEVAGVEILRRVADGGG